MNRRGFRESSASETLFGRFINRVDGCIRLVTRLSHPFSQISCHKAGISALTKLFQRVEFTHPIWSATRHPGNQLISILSKHACRWCFDDVPHHRIYSSGHIIRPILIDCCSMGSLQAFSVNVIWQTGEK